MAWWERPLARLRGDRTPSAPTGTAPAVASVPAPGEWNDVPRLQRVLQGRAGFWAGLVLLMAASCVLEWSRLYSFEARLPGHSGGVLGSVLGPVAVQWACACVRACKDKQIQRNPS